MNDLIGMVEQFLAMIMEAQDEFSDDELEELFQTANDVMMFIQEREQEAKPIVNPSEELPLAPHESSQINGFNYSPETGKLQVQFHGKYPKAAGSIYEYDDVPPWVYELFQRGAIAPKTSGSNRFHRWERGKTPSHGASMNAAIKAGGFNYRKVA
jgi:hypothetical protein